LGTPYLSMAYIISDLLHGVLREILGKSLDDPEAATQRLFHA